jgi:hypothetical protein
MRIFLRVAVYYIKKTGEETELGIEKGVLLSHRIENMTKKMCYNLDKEE